MNPNAGKPVNPLSDLENVVAAAQQAAAAAQTPKGQFEEQFGSGVTPLDPSIKTVDGLLAKGPQTVEAVVPAKQTPAEKLKQQIAASVNAFLEEVTKEKIPA